jgi:formylglycine-generating enzyme required for sulfatase activity
MTVEQCHMNTPLQRGGNQPAACRNRFNGFSRTGQIDESRHPKPPDTVKKAILNLVVLLVALVLPPCESSAQVAVSPPGQLSYQGFLTDAGGIPLATNSPRNYTVVFRIYDASTGGNELWAEQQVVTVDRGYFTVSLGSGSVFGSEPFTNDLTAVFSGLTASDRYIGMTLTDPGLSPSPSEIVPRLQLMASPYAVLARNATTLVSPNGSNLVIAANGQVTVNGIITGNGAGLTGLNASNLTGTLTMAQLPATVVTTNAVGVNLSGTLSGNGAGLTNIPISAVLPPPPCMVLIPAGSFTMGNVTGDSDIGDAPPVPAYVSAFYMDVNMVDLSQWFSVYFWATNHGYSFATNAGAGKAANHPVLMVNWYDAVKWCNARSEQAGQVPAYYTDPTLTNVYRTGQIDMANACVNWAANGYRLPTEAEYEKAMRGGTTNRFPWGDLVNQNLANYYGNTNSYPYDLGPNGYNPIGRIGGTSPATSPVGSFAPNGYGLYDMAGNAFEWCWDSYVGGYIGGSDPHGPANPNGNRVFRGGANWFNADRVRCAQRGYDKTGQPDGGVRCVRGL